jgi:hypothetical protein
MDARTYLKISTINLLFLLVGVFIGVAFMSGLVSVHAQDQTKDSVPVHDQATTKVERASSTCDESKFECVVPEISGRAAAFGVLLAGRTASDQAAVNGYDILKLHQSLLNTLQEKKILSTADVQGIIQSARVEKPLRVK